MDKEIISGLVCNASLLLAISIIYNLLYLEYEKSSKCKNMTVGLMIGFVGILLMQISVKIAPGVIFDTRSILVCVSAMFFGVVPSFISVVIIVAYRIIIGGHGTLMGVLVTILTCVVGVAWNKLRFKYIFKRKNSAYIEFYIVGFIAHVIMIMCVLALPHHMIFNVYRQITIPILLIYPIASMLLSIVLFNVFRSNQTRLELKESEKKYRKLYYEHQNKQTLLKKLIDSVPDLIFYKDVNGRYVGCNSAFEKISGIEEKDLIGLTDLEIFDIDMANSFRKVDKEILKNNEPKTNDEIVTYPDGKKVFLETIKTPYSNCNGTTLGIIGISRDITERKKREEERFYLTYHDVLTGLYNRAFFEEKRKLIDIEQQMPYSVIVGDINGLKLINDAFGHEEGDKLLIEIAKILRLCCREEDIICRLGGDEFCILLPKTNAKSAESIIEIIKKKCRDYSNKAEKETYYASISLGHATKLKIEEPFEKVFRVAEELMYRAKLFKYKSVHSSIISSIKTTMFEKSNETEEHAERLALLSKKLGKALGLDNDAINELELLATLHDIGKITISDSVLKKPDKLTEDDWVEMKKHPEVGYRISNASQELKHISEYILSHHERWDGKGYPQGLSGKNIPLLSRILAIVDSYDAMTEDRVYRKAMTKDEAIKEIINNAGTQFDPEIARIFVDEVLNGD